MQIQLQGLGIYDIEKQNYNEFKNILDLDNDLFLELVAKSLDGFSPVLCINTDIIIKEGLMPYGHIQTDIGIERLNNMKNIIKCIS